MNTPLLTDPAGREWTPVDCATSILEYLKSCAGDYLGYEVEDAVITVPAYFDAIARIHTKKAAQNAGFKKVELLDEPVSAAVFYGLEKDEKKYIVVVDFGGGTLDVTAVETDGHNIKAKFTDGDAELGGANYDEAILELMRKEAKAEGIEISAENDLATFYQNLDRAREAKEMLSWRDEVTLIAEADGKRKAIKFTRSLLKEVGRPFDDRFMQCCRNLHEQIEASGRKVDKIILVGGSSRFYTNAPK